MTYRRKVSKVDEIHRIDDGVMSDEQIAEVVGCHAAYVRSVRIKAKRNAAYAAIRKQTDVRVSTPERPPVQEVLL